MDVKLRAQTGQRASSGEIEHCGGKMQLRAGYEIWIDLEFHGRGGTEDVFEPTAAACHALFGYRSRCYKGQSATVGQLSNKGCKLRLWQTFHVPLEPFYPRIRA